MKLRNAVLIGGLLLLAAVSYFIGGRMERATFENPQERLKIAREAFLADEDGAAFKMFVPFIVILPGLLGLVVLPKLTGFGIAALGATILVVLLYYADWKAR